jgi:N-acetylglutamate synthase-like GNAT family acetyltransferase
MFVAASHRGRTAGAAQALLDRLTAKARNRDVRQLWLGTTDRFLAAHRFYEKNGFGLVAAESLPASFPRMAVDSRFYGLTLG